MNAAYYARHARAVELAGLERSLTPVEVSLLLVVLEEAERGVVLSVDRLAAMLGLPAAPANELRALSIAGLLDVEQQKDGGYSVAVTDRGGQKTKEIRRAVTEQLHRWVALIRVAA